jgi:hypothetical protein
MLAKNLRKPRASVSPSTLLMLAPSTLKTRKRERKKRRLLLNKQTWCTYITTELWGVVLEYAGIGLQFVLYKDRCTADTRKQIRRAIRVVSWAKVMECAERECIQCFHGRLDDVSRYDSEYHMCQFSVPEWSGTRTDLCKSCFVLQPNVVSERWLIDAGISGFGAYCAIVLEATVSCLSDKRRSSSMTLMVGNTFVTHDPETPWYTAHKRIQIKLFWVPHLKSQGVKITDLMLVRRDNTKIAFCRHLRMVGAYSTNRIQFRSFVHLHKQK